MRSSRPSTPNWRMPRLSTTCGTPPCVHTHGTGRRGLPRTVKHEEEAGVGVRRRRGERFRVGPRATAPLLDVGRVLPRGIVVRVQRDVGTLQVGQDVSRHGRWDRLGRRRRRRRWRRSRRGRLGEVADARAGHEAGHHIIQPAFRWVCVEFGESFAGRGGGARRRATAGERLRGIVPAAPPPARGGHPHNARSGTAFPPHTSHATGLQLDHSCPAGSGLQLGILAHSPPQHAYYGQLSPLMDRSPWSTPNTGRAHPVWSPTTQGIQPTHMHAYCAGTQAHRHTGTRTRSKNVRAHRFVGTILSFLANVSVGGVGAVRCVASHAPSRYRGGEPDAMAWSTRVGACGGAVPWPASAVDAKDEGRCATHAAPTTCTSSARI